MKPDTSQSERAASPAGRPKVKRIRLRLREKVLLSLILWTLILWAGISVIGGTVSLQARLSLQKPQIEALAENASLLPEVQGQQGELLSRFPKGVDASPETIVETLDGIVRARGLRPDISAPSTSEGDQFSLHRVRVDFRNTKIEDLLSFAEAVEELSPTYAFEYGMVSSNPGNPVLLDSSFEIVAYEITGADAPSENP